MSLCSSLRFWWDLISFQAQKLVQSSVQPRREAGELRRINIRAKRRRKKESGSGFSVRTQQEPAAADPDPKAGGISNVVALLFYAHRT